MTYNSTNEVSPLASRKWRVRHSAWLLAPILGFGALSFVGFVYVALRVRTRKFWIAGILGCIGSAMAYAAVSLFGKASDGDKYGTWAGGVEVAVWAGLLVYGFILNRDYLRWRATRTAGNAWYNQPNSAPASPTRLAPPPLAQAAPPSGNASTTRKVVDERPLGVDTSDYYADVQAARATPLQEQFAPPPSPAGRPPAESITGTTTASIPIDVNAASAHDLIAALHVDAALADRIVAERSTRGSYQDLDDLVATARLQPHEMMKLRGKVVFGPPSPKLSSPAAPQKPMGNHSGRILDF